MSKTYEVNDYLDVLKGQMSEEKFIATKRSVYLSSMLFMLLFIVSLLHTDYLLTIWIMNGLTSLEKHRNYPALLALYEDMPEEQHLFGFMYLEGLGVEQDYAKAMYYFDNTTNPLFNSSYHVFGRGILHFYGKSFSHNVLFLPSFLLPSSCIYKQIFYSISSHLLFVYLHL